MERASPRGPRGLRAWLLTTDHKRIGILFLVATSLSMALGGLFALLLRIELLTPDETIVSAMTYNRLFTLHGVVMVWLFMIPAIPGAFGNYMVPLMIGAEEIAFPRLNLMSFWIYVLGSSVTLAGMFFGAADTGWTFYTPYSSSTPAAVVPVVIGIFILGISTIMSGVNFLVTIHTLRREEMTWTRLPLFVWAMYSTSIILVLATPVLALSLAIVGIDHALDWGLFDPSRGGDPVLYQHLFWFYSHPAVYIMILPAMGVVSEVISTMSHKNPASYNAIALSSLGIAFVGFLTWGHHMFVAGMSVFDAGAFGLLTMLVAIFSAIKVFTWVATLHRGSIIFTTPLAYVFAFLFLFVFGGMTGVAVATLALDVHWTDTTFIVAHFHFIMVGGTLTAFLAALHYWFPRMTGRTYPERWGLVGASLVSLGFFVTFFPQFLLGNAGMPRRSFSYLPELQALNIVSTTGSWLLGLGLLLTAGYLFAALVRGPVARTNPWRSLSLEWRTPHGARPEIGPYDYHLPEGSHV
jgi:cytochrome c oxidase subunit I